MLARDIRGTCGKSSKAGEGRREQELQTPRSHLLVPPTFSKARCEPRGSHFAPRVLSSRFLLVVARPVFFASRTEENPCQTVDQISRGVGGGDVSELFEDRLVQAPGVATSFFLPGANSSHFKLSFRDIKNSRAQGSSASRHASQRDARWLW